MSHGPGACLVTARGCVQRTISCGPDAVFRDQGEESIGGIGVSTWMITAPGVAFPLLFAGFWVSTTCRKVRLVENRHPRNDPETGMQVMRSVAHHGLDITRDLRTRRHCLSLREVAAHVPLPLRANEADVRRRLAHGFCGRSRRWYAAEDDRGADLRIAFVFDGVLADDSAGECSNRGWISIRRMRVLTAGVRSRPWSDGVFGEKCWIPEDRRFQVRVITGVSASGARRQRQAPPRMSGRSARSRVGPARQRRFLPGRSPKDPILEGFGAPFSSTTQRPVEARRAT